MKKISTLLVSILALVALMAPELHAAPTSASTATIDFSNTNVTTSYVQMFSAASVVKAVKGIMISHSGNLPLLIAVGGAGFEVDQLKVPAGSAVPGNSAAVFYPLAVSQNQRISVKTTSGTLSAGALIMNVLYN